MNVISLPPEARSRSEAEVDPKNKNGRKLVEKNTVEPSGASRQNQADR